MKGLLRALAGFADVGARSSRMIIRKSPSELEKMRRAGLLVYEVLQKLAPMVQEGATTWDLEVEADRMIRDAGARPRRSGGRRARVRRLYQRDARCAQTRAASCR